MNAKEIRKGNKAIKVISNVILYGQYYGKEFQVLKSDKFSERRYKNWIKKYEF